MTVSVMLLGLIVFLPTIPALAFLVYKYDL